MGTCARARDYTKNKINANIDLFKAHITNCALRIVSCRVLADTISGDCANRNGGNTD